MARRTCPTSSIATRAARAPAPASSRLLISRSRPSARRRTARIVCPSGANGDVGIKPTLGLWSRAGVVPISADQDTAGPIARNVTDAAVLLGAATGVDPNDAATAAQAGQRLHRLHPVPQRSRAPGRSNRRLARRHLRPGVGGLGRRADPRQRDRRAQGPRCDRDRSGPTSTCRRPPTSSRRSCASSRPTSRRTSTPTSTVRTRCRAQRVLRKRSPT